MTTLTLVSGLSRCGSTMMMHMLAAGGVDVVGAPPAYEVDEAAMEAIDQGAEGVETEGGQPL